MTQTKPHVRPLPWLEPHQDFPPVELAWGEADPAPGLLAAGGVLDVPTLVAAYSQGIFPWYSAGQPILWWSTHPRMALQTNAFRMHRSLRKSLMKLLSEQRLTIRFDHDFDRVIQACANTPRGGQSGTWILPPMVQAYMRLNRAGLAHCVETWIDGELAGGLYCVGLGGMVFGESMFSHQTNASKYALAALVAFCRASDIPMIDCQQDTPHLASLGAQPMARSDFCHFLKTAIARPSPVWDFQPVYWNQLIEPRTIDDGARE